MNRLKLGLYCLLLCSPCYVAADMPERTYIPYVGTYDNPKLLKEPAIVEALQRILSATDYQHFYRNQQVFSPVGMEDQYIYSLGCRQHNCRDESSMLAIHVHSGNIYGYIFTHNRFHLFASTPLSDSEAGVVTHAWQEMLPTPVKKHILYTLYQTEVLPLFDTYLHKITP